MAISEYALALSLLLGTLLVPFFAAYQMLRLRRRAMRGAAVPAVPRKDRPDMPYVDINPHKGRPNWQGYAVLAVLLVLTAAVVGAALVRV